VCVLGDFMNYLNSSGLTTHPCEVVYIPDAPSVEAVAEGDAVDDERNNGVGFAMYVPQSMTIYVAGNMQPYIESGEIEQEDADNVILESLAHEYVHHVQHMDNRLFLFNKEEVEREAEEKAILLLNDYLANRGEGFGCWRGACETGTKKGI